MSSPQEPRSALATGAPSQAISKGEISLALTGAPPYLVLAAGGSRLSEEKSRVGARSIAQLAANNQQPNNLS